MPAHPTLRRTFVVTVMENKKNVCTGALINALLALTTATCILRTLDLGAKGCEIEVTAGKNNMQRGHFGRGIAITDIHDNYVKFKEQNPSAKFNPFDIGCIKVSKVILRMKFKQSILRIIL